MQLRVEAKQRPLFKWLSIVALAGFCFYLIPKTKKKIPSSSQLMMELFAVKIFWPKNYRTVGSWTGFRYIFSWLLSGLLFPYEYRRVFDCFENIQLNLWVFPHFYLLVESFFPFGKLLTSSLGLLWVVLGLGLGWAWAWASGSILARVRKNKMQVTYMGGPERGVWAKARHQQGHCQTQSSPLLQFSIS